FFGLGEALVRSTAPPPPPPPSGGTPRLHDPEGAARNLLAAAQLAADTLTSDADVYAAGVRSEADEYAALTRGEADEHAARVTTTAETQAAAIREVAADEARRVAEETRAELVDEISALEGRRDELSTEVAAIETHVDTERSRMLGMVDDLRAAVLAGGGLVAAKNIAEADEGPGDGEAASDVSLDEQESAGASDIGTSTDAVDSDETVVDDDESDPESEAARSVFDEPDPHAADTSAEWLDEEPPAATIFDVESEDDAGGPPTASMQAVDGAGERFFDELRDAESDSLGPLDDDTDAALSAFFDGDEEGDTSGGRWRDRFGPGGT
ncbi:MAG: hypothetical protein ACR2PK_02340, partial [Acidimicrobiales bacterium]